MNQNAFGGRAPPASAGVAHNTPPDLLDLRAPTYEGKGGGNAPNSVSRLDNTLVYLLSLVVTI